MTCHIQNWKKQNIHGPLLKQKLLLDLIQKNKAGTSRTEFSWNYKMYTKIKRFQNVGSSTLKKYMIS